MPSTTDAFPSATAPHHRWEPIPSSLLRQIYESDQAIYPAPDLSLARLQSWANAYPDLCLCLRRGYDQEPPQQPQPKPQQQQQQQQQHHEQRINNPHSNPYSDVLGVMIVLPIQQPSWDLLLSATIREHDIDPRTMFPFSDLDRHVLTSPAEKERESGSSPVVGLHVFHVERFAASNAVELEWVPSKRFTDLALAEIQQRVAEKFGIWKVAGWSALTATPQGHRAFQRIGFLIKYLETDGGVTWLDEGADGSSLDLPKPVMARMVVRTGNDPF